MKHRKYLINFCWLSFSVAFLCLILVINHTLVLPPLLLTSIHLYSTNISLSDQTNHSINNSSSMNQQFEFRRSMYHPHLPIHIYSQNLSRTENTSKLILLGNAFFGDRRWGSIIPVSKGSTPTRTPVYCPFLSVHCDLTNNYNDFSQADAVVYHMCDKIDMDRVKKHRHSRQRFVFTLWEPPVHTSNLQFYRQFFNWTMTYRTDSHIVASYYYGYAYIHTSSEYYRMMLYANATRQIDLKPRTSDHRPSDEILAKKKLGLVAALISNCGGSSKRLEFIEKLKRYVDVEIYGRCGIACPQQVHCRKFISENYYFFLSFENSLCTDYASDKIFAGLEYSIVPVVLGRSNYSSLVPSSGYIDTRDFPTTSSLAEHLKETRQNKEQYLSYFSWKKDYVWGVSHYFNIYCGLCLRLHLDNKENIIDNIHKWWFDGTCEVAHVHE